MQRRGPGIRSGAHALAAILLASCLAGCGGLSGILRRAPVGIDGARCVGRVTAPRFAARPVADQALEAEAVGASGKGGVCTAKVLVVEEDVRVYRVWDSSRARSAYGRWWSLTRPEGPRDAYRREYAICPAWSALDRLLSCTVRRGTAIVVGPTQSATCETGTYPKTGHNQVYVRNDAANGQLLVSDCRDEGPWPQAH